MTGNASGEDSANFLRIEYEYVTRLLIDSEQLDERRIEFFVSLVAGLLGISGIIL